MDKRQVGNRRSEEEIEQIKIDDNKAAFILEEQTHFTGTPEQLEMMQNFERYYIDGDPKISDEEWDILKNRFGYEESLTSTSPSGRKWIKMLSPLPSINKAGNIEELKVFLNSFKDSQIFKVEAKLDGLTANLIYKLENTDNGLIYRLQSITSRGNGRYGLELNPFALSGVRKNWPETINTTCVIDILEIEDDDACLPDFFELRGEAVVNKNERTFKKYGENAVWRSVASGMFNRKVPFNLNGLLIYLFGTDKVDRVTEIENIGDARLIASLSSDTDKFLRNDKVFVFPDGKVEIRHSTGITFEFYDDGEEIDIVFYSASIGDSNIDTDKIKNIPGVKYISDIKYQESATTKVPHLYRETSDRSQIISAVNDFYGTDDTGKRNLTKDRTRNMYEYALDGIVIKPIDSNRETQGMFFRNHKNNPNKIVCPKYPEDQIAVKLLSEMVKVKLDHIECTKTSLGNVTCCGVLDRAYMTESGSMVSNINLHNPEWLMLNDWIKPGEEYYMVMSMDIIPVLLNPNLF